MATKTALELLDWLGNNLFLPAAQIGELRSQLAAWPDGHALAKELIRRNWLTPYQVNQILQDKGDALIAGANRLLERLGEGAMGQVFKAWNTRLGRHVAVKMIHKEHVASDKAMKRFRREVETASQLDHPNIVLVRDADETHGRPFMVMEFIVGEDLAQRVRQNGPLPLGEAVEFARQAALGLQHAYERGVVHRDIKPGNLILALSATAAPVVKILDFGLARFDSDARNANRLTYSGNLLGTVDYIAPEQAHDAHAADIRADIYGLGCSLYYMLAGKPPFPGSTVVEKISARMIGNPPSIRELRPDVPTDLDAILRRMMAREPADRFATPHEAAQALAPFAKWPDESTAPVVAPAPIAPAPPLALAVPLARPLPAGVPVVQALPVARPLAANAVTVGPAIPIVEAIEVDAMPDVVVPVPGGEGAPFGEHAEGMPFGGDSDPTMPLGRSATASSPQPTKPKSRAFVVGLIGGAVALLVVVVTVVVVAKNMRGPPSSGRGYGSGAALRILPLESMTLREGRKTPVIVKIQRKDFSGPVRVSFEKLPSGLQSAEITIKEGQEMDQLYLMASFGSGIQKAELRLVAVAENLRDVFLLHVHVGNNRLEPGAK